MSATKLLAEVKKFSPRIPVIMSSGYIDEAERDRLHLLGVVGILGKPYGSLELIAAINTAIEDAKNPPFPPL